MSEIIFSNKYKPLFELLEGKHPEVDTVVITGGRGSAKSFNVAVFSVIALVNYYHDVLYTRFTNVSIVDSIKPEVDGKIELLSYEPYVEVTNTHIHNKSGNRIAFKGIKTGSKLQTANLKSLSGFSILVIDEAEETPDYETFEKVYLSIRSNTKRNLTILILNPSTSQHWIYEHFFAKRNIEGGSNTIYSNTLYIHTSYLDVERKYLADNIVKYYERLKEEDPNKYEQVVLGGWVTEPEGVLLPISQLKFADLSDIPEEAIVYKFAVGDPADTGGDHFSIPFMHVAIQDGNVSCFVKDVIHTTDGIEVTNERAIEKSRLNYIEDVYLEKNGVGTAAYYLLKRDLANHATIKPFNSRVSKEVRILSHYEFVKKYFIFDAAYKSNPEYALFIKHLTGYQRDDAKENRNEHKLDAIDVVCSAASVLKIKYKSILYG